MTSEYVENLVFVQTEDSLELEGLIIRPTRPSRAASIVWIHGNTGKFCERSYVELGREIARRGCTFVSGNTRGHDLATLFFQGDDVFPAGSAWERFDEAPLDIAAWIDFTAGADSGKVVLAGHSMGASKVVFHVATHPDARVVGIIAASPLANYKVSAERLALAESMVNTGSAQELLPSIAGAPMWNVISAQTVASRPNVIARAFRPSGGDAWISRVRCPLLAFYGTNEDEAIEQLETIRTHAGGPCETQLIQNADHSYVGRQREVSRQIVAWIDALPDLDTGPPV